MIRRFVVILLAALLAHSGLVNAQDQTYVGTLNDAQPTRSYTVQLAAGQSILVMADATSGDLDAVLTLTDPNGRTVIENDDRSSDTLDPAIGYTALEDGKYTITISRYQGEPSSGEYRLEVTIGDESILQVLDEISRIQLSGETQTVDTEHFRIHYTLEGVDATTDAYVEALALSMEEIWQIQIEQMGWPPPPADSGRGGNQLYDVYLADLVGSGENAYAYTAPEDLIGDHPLTEAVEENAATSYIVMENDFDLALGADETPTSLMRTTMAHEFHHAIQFGYDVDDMLWYYEATSTWMEAAGLTKDEDATGYVEYVYKYPELCFGTESDEAGGLFVYGSWLFIQTMVDQFGMESVQRLWENIAQYEGFEALERTLEAYGTDMASMMASYHQQNLVRDFALAQDFNATVWLENTVDAPGRWTFTGRGIQELGANYYELTLPEGTYYAGLVNDNARLRLWAIGVRGTEADAIALERGGNITTAGYDHLYLLVMNPEYRNTVDRCEYYDYSIDVTVAKGEAMPVTKVWNASQFEPLQ